jgi:hypothetical protein
MLTFDHVKKKPTTVLTTNYTKFEFIHFREQYIIEFLSDYCATICTRKNMSSRSVSDIQTRAEGESLYIRYRSDANVLSHLKNDPSNEFIGEVILKINIV